MDKLACDGGTPVFDSPLPYARHSLDHLERNAVDDVLAGDWLTGGYRIEDFEKHFAFAVGAERAVAFSSGTAALHGAMKSLFPNNYGGNVIVPALTFVSTANAALHCGFRVKFADVCPDTLCIDLKDVRQKVGAGTIGVVAMDYAGIPADLNNLHVMCASWELHLIEDAAHAIGTMYRGKPIGSFPWVTCFSTHAVKNITTAEGGVAVTTDLNLVDACMRAFRNHGIVTTARQREAEGAWAYDMCGMGYNFRMSDVHAAIGLAQLAKLQRFLAHRRLMAALYFEAFSRNLPDIQLPTVPHESLVAWHFFPVRLPLDKLKVDRDQFLRALRAEGVLATVHYKPVHLHTYYRNMGFKPGMCPVAEREWLRLISLPTHPCMTEADAMKVVDAVEKVWRHYHV